MEMNRLKSETEIVKIDDPNEKRRITRAILEALQAWFEVEAIFGDEYFLSYTDEAGVVTLLDTFLIFYKDMTFEAYSFIKDDVVLTGSGDYEFDETGDFHILPFEEDNGKITMSYDYSIQNSEPASATFDLTPLATACFYVARPADAPAE